MERQVTIPIIIIVVVLLLVGGMFLYYQDQTFITPTTTPSTSKNDNIAVTLAYQQGDVQVKVGDGDWQSVETDTILHQGDSIKTGTDSKAIIELENGDIFRLGYSTEVFFTSLKKNAVTLTQVDGASYHRVTKNTSRFYLVKSDNVTVQSVGTAFDVVETDESVDVTTLESEVKVLTDEDEESVTEGKTAKYDKESKDIVVDDIDEDDLTNDWYTWNKEEDSKKTDELGVLTEYAGPELSIDSPGDGAKLDSGEVLVQGTVNDFDAKLFVNGEEIENSAGQFIKKVSLLAGKNIITVIAEDTNGNRTIKEVKIFYQVNASATPIQLKAETEDEGVHLDWNESTGIMFESYKVVRSETNANLKYPDDGYVVKRDKGQESYLDTNVEAEKTYYYRVCEIMVGGEVFCSNIVYMKGKKVEVEDSNDKSDDSDSSESDDSSSEDEQESDQVSSTGIKLVGEAEDNGIKLEWEVTGLNIEYGFKIAKAETANPVYPGNDYQYISDSSAMSYTWPLTDGKTYHFRVCQYNGDGKCLVYSNDIAVTAKQPSDDDVNLIMSAKAEDSGVGLWWTDVSEEIAGFKYYKVVRSETNADLRYPDDGHIAVKSEDSESHRDYSANRGTSYYYRICAVGNSIYCSNVVQVTAINDNAAPEAVTLSASYDNEEKELALSWTASTEKDFSYYKVVWSQTNSSPVYPADGYIKAISSASDTSYKDEGSEKRDGEVDLSTGTHYYSVCVVDQASQVTCSNVVTLINGVVQ